jgi:myo-inositol catabolism protein IolC
MEEFCMKVRKFEIVNSRKYSIFSRVIPRTIKFVLPVSLSHGWFKNNGPIKNRWTTLNLQVKIRDCWVLVGPYPNSY